MSFRLPTSVVTDPMIVVAAMMIVIVALTIVVTVQTIAVAAPSRGKIPFVICSCHCRLRVVFVVL